ncbi:isochorismate synthase [Flagellimonas allohymeniacidonis]|uniref:isochorismate synthase n=1 Tax=Flagellimonas allohymeniacidonis TaxID=2517819 RepID=A0A4Q8QGW8_9FLAO|nr:isochorismate synthase [Allomuricauda hymeniacidonis]
MDKVLNKGEDWIQRNLPFCIYRKPNSDKVQGVFQNTDELHKTEKFKEEGFVFAPFDLSKGAILIQPDERIESTHILEEQKVVSTIPQSEEGKLFHINLVCKGLEVIKSGEIQKVVLSRKIDVQTKRQPIELFTSLLNSYSNAFCYLFFHPKIGLWCGATPETLVSIKQRKLTTVSLAGTLPIIDNSVPYWEKKELEEQGVVTSFIQEKLRPYLKKIHSGALETVRAGKLWHLKTPLTGELLPDASVVSVVRALHPTPAVCGLPVNKATAFILENEGYDRTFYTGFLGELNLEGKKEVSLFVNLRCMQLEGGNARIFVGGGITAESIPEKEWEETQNKSRTMLNML